ncbi:DgyrCDS5290 [Dimorphilus gyrociliatus]|uniref:Gamma-tubulin complex component n=1 Tax=Dimorphilus gyrociliatus TaxID=2664684 RepID=A0A7I8VJJ4_9ANNE|nr:DgyrCDS5290 [Dimorphilus gyrociliatus]
MLHELLFALNGKIGGVFVQNEKKEVKIIKDLPFLQPSEAVLADRLCQLATYYIKFLNLIKTRTSLVDNEENTGIYIRSFYASLDKILQPYRDALVILEEKLYKDPHISAAAFQAELEDYQLIFPALSNVIDQIEEQNERGCQILSVLSSAANIGSPTIRRYMIQMLQICHCVFYRQLAAWLLHGLLIDPYNEFFIQKRQENEDEEKDEEEEPEFEERIVIRGISGTELKKILHTAFSHNEEMIRKKEYGLHMNMLPIYIPKRVAEKVLFVGESIQMFEQDRSLSDLPELRNILEDKEENFTKLLNSLAEEEEFNLRKFEGFVNEVRTYVAEHLWKLIVQKSNLIGRLRRIKEFYLFGRGELFLTFIHENFNAFSSPPTGSSKHDVNLALQQATRSVLLDDDQLEKFRLTIDQQKTNYASELTAIDELEANCIWNSLNLEHTVEWPLHIVLTPTVITRYNMIFKFLLRVRRVQTALHSCWVDSMDTKSLPDQFCNNTRWWLRNHMNFIVNNLQFYLQVDVIEWEFSELLEKINKTMDFEHVSVAHDAFVTSLLTKSFLLTKPISNCIRTILDLCLAYTKLIKKSGEFVTDSDNEFLSSITKSFERQTKILVQILSDVRNHGSSPHIRQLLLRIDYNRFFSSAK